MLRSNKTYTLWNLITFPFSCAPLSSALLCLMTLIQAALPIGKVLVTAAFIDTAQQIFWGTEAQAHIVTPLLGLVGIVFIEWLGDNVRQLLNKNNELKLRHALRASIISKQARLQYRYIENQDTWDLIMRITKDVTGQARDPETRVSQGFNQLLEAVSAVFTLLSVMTIIIAYAWWIGLIVLILCVPLVMLAFRGGKKTYEAERENTEHTRRHTYLFDVLSGREFTEERALFGYSERFIRHHTRFLEAGRRIYIRMHLKWMARSKAMSIAISVALCGVFVALLVPVSQGVMSAGIMISLVGAVQNISTMLSWQVSFLVDGIANNMEYMKDLTRFAALEESDNALSLPRLGQTLDTLEFRNVRFKYPGTDRYILDGISFTIGQGRHYSFVGANGAGKTTITKLITGLYDDYEGEIFINGREIRTLPGDALKGYTVCVFQDFAKYQIPLRDNITIGCAGTTDTDARITGAIDAVGLQEIIDGLPLGLDQPLGKIDAQGQDISGGQWQRVALARAVASPAPLRILDEPTAALDPISESQVYQQFEHISHGMTTIFISHRLGSTKLADEIFVIHDGSIAEQGTHDALMTTGGIYAQMYDSQRSWYQ